MPNRKELMIREDRQCRHFRSILEGKSCHAEINYSDLRKHGDLPCFGDTGDSIAKCSKHQPYTLEETQAKEEKFRTEFMHISIALAAIKTLSGTVGSIDCPQCQGKLSWTRSTRNKHIYGNCETPDCLRWMQ